jgi:fibronectin type 3 domain-containing protein
MISWQAVAGAASYDVYYNTSNTLPSIAQQSGISGTSTTITGLTNGNVYYVWVKAQNVIGSSDLSPAASGKPLGIPVAPTVTPRDAQLTVSWTAVAGADSYDVYYDTSTTQPSAAQQSDITDTSTTITGLNNGTTYNVWIKAKNAYGTSNFSPMASGSPVGPPPAPGTPTVTAGNGQLAVSWQAVTGASTYEVWLGTTDNAAEATKYGADVSGTSTSITGHSNGTTYYVWVKAKNSAGTSGFSPQASGTPLAPPLNIRAVSQSVESILVTWDEAAGGVSYKVYRSNTGGSDYTPLGSSSTSPYTDSGLSAGTYYYKVSTVKGGDESALSAAVSATTQIGTSIVITLASQNDVDISDQSVVIPRGQSPGFQVAGSYTSYQWYLNGSAISGATAASYTLNTASMKLGVYKLSIMVSTNAGEKLAGSCRVRVE